MDDTQRFRRVYELNYDAVHAFAYRRLRDRSLAGDVTAEVFLVAWRRLDDLPTAPRAWLFGVARRVIMATHRALPPISQLLDDVATPSSEPGPAERFEHFEELQRVATAMDALSETDREVLLLATWEDLSVLELAQALDCSRTAAAVRLHRARTRLRGHLEHPIAALAAAQRAAAIRGDRP